MDIKHKPYLKYLFILLFLWIIGFALAKIAEFKIDHETPEIVRVAVAKAKNSDRINRKIGDISSEIYEFIPTNGDSASYYIKLHGEDGSIEIRSKITQKGNEWNSYSSDTTYIIY